MDSTRGVWLAVCACSAAGMLLCCSSVGFAADDPAAEASPVPDAHAVVAAAPAAQGPAAAATQALPAEPPMDAAAVRALLEDITDPELREAMAQELQEMDGAGAPAAAEAPQHEPTVESQPVTPIPSASAE